MDSFASDPAHIAGGPRVEHSSAQREGSSVAEAAVGGDKPDGSRVLWGEAVLVLFAALAVRISVLDEGAAGDELYNYLAAQSYVEDGTLSINGGEPYTRGRIWTLLVAAALRVFGVSLASARIPSAPTGRCRRRPRP